MGSLLNYRAISGKSRLSASSEVAACLHPGVRRACPGAISLWRGFWDCHFASVVVKEVDFLVVFEYVFGAMKAIQSAVLLVFILQTALLK